MILWVISFLELILVVTYQHMLHLYMVSHLGKHLPLQSICSWFHHNRIRLFYLHKCLLFHICKQRYCYLRYCILRLQDRLETGCICTGRFHYFLRHRKMVPQNFQHMMVGLTYIGIGFFHYLLSNKLLLISLHKKILFHICRVQLKCHIFHL